jgi:hypothetical protein
MSAWFPTSGNGRTHLAAPTLLARSWSVEFAYEVAPTLVPSFDVTVYLVLDDFGPLGRV